MDGGVVVFYGFIGTKCTWKFWKYWVLGGRREIFRYCSHGSVYILKCSANLDQLSYVGLHAAGLWLPGLLSLVHLLVQA